jgi:SAM-dependent MidA family methyltransferase
MDTLAKLVLNNRGAVLNIDYGANSVFSNSIRAIKQHKFVPQPYFWSLPGKCDISAYVNFRSLAHFAYKLFIMSGNKMQEYKHLRLYLKDSSWRPWE